MRFVKVVAVIADRMRPEGTSPTDRTCLREGSDTT